jgi:L-fuculose-phosphate aldolase
MLLEQARDDVVRTCRELAAAGLVVGTSGNVSVRARELIAVSPSGLDYADLTAGLVGVHRLDGTPVEAPLRPTSEMPLHLAVYAATGAGAIVHSHPVAATALSTLTAELPAIHYQVAMFGGPVPVAPYATYGSEQLARNVATALSDRTACLMANHGALTTGPDLRSALTGTRYLEWLCEVYLRALAAGQPAGPRLLPADEIALVAGQLASYGQRVPDGNPGRSG